ncbi:MAG: Lon-like protease helical domain-containing protein [Dehalococcoidia bacterium]
MTSLSPSTATALTPAQLRRRCDPNGFGFTTTADLAPVSGLVGQQRAAEALSLGLAMAPRGFNVFASGAPRTGKTAAVRAFLEASARERPTPADWCYVHNFDDASRPKALRLAPGQGRALREGLRRLVEAARREIPRVFESEDYVTRREAIMATLNKRREAGVAQLTTRAQTAGFLLQFTPMGIALVPVMGNRPLSDEDLAGLRAEMREMIDRRREELEVEVRAFLKDMRVAERRPAPSSKRRTARWRSTRSVAWWRTSLSITPTNPT